MTGPEPQLRDVSDTARWVAWFRAQESDRPDAQFKDPFARKLAGERGAKIAEELKEGKRVSWAFVARTVAFDEFIGGEVARGVDVVVNLAAGFDARPYRLALPSTLQWIEVDLPPLLDAKRAAMESEKPTCRLERIALDLADAAARKKLFAEIGARGKNVLVLTEGLLVYLGNDEVAALARDLHAVPTFQRWIVYVASPKLLAMMQRGVGRRLASAGAPLRFAAPGGADHFVPFGWKPVEVKSSLHVGARIGRLSWFMKLIAKLPQPSPPWKGIWSGICLLERTG